MEGKEIAPFVLTNRRQMTRELGYTRQAGYEHGHVFVEQAVRQFGPTHKAEKSLTQMGFMKYHGDIAKFSPDMENLNRHVRVTGIAWTKMIDDQIPEDAIRRLSLREYMDDGEW